MSLLAPKPSRRSLILGGPALAALATATGGAAPLPDTLHLSSLDHEVARALALYSAANNRACACEGQGDDAGEASAQKQADQLWTCVGKLADELMSRPIQSLADCVTYARLIEAGFDGIPHEDDVDDAPDLGHRVLYNFVIGLLRLVGLPRHCEPYSNAEKEAREPERRRRLRQHWHEQLGPEAGEQRYQEIIAFEDGPWDACHGDLDEVVS